MCVFLVILSGCVKVSVTASKLKLRKSAENVCSLVTEDNSGSFVKSVYMKL